MKLQKFTSADRDIYYSMSKKFYSSEATLHDCSQSVRENVFDDVLSDSPFIEGYIICDDGTPIGYALLANSYGTEFGKRVLWVEELYIDENFRNKGIGSKFMKWLDSECKKKNAVARLEVSPANENVFDFYYRCGFDNLDYLQMVKTEIF